MKVVVAIDSFKGSLSSKEAGECVKSSILEFCDDVEVVCIADGGEGSVEAMMQATNSSIKTIKTLDPLNREILADYAKNDELAIIEMASSSGLTLLKDYERNPNLTSTHGLGIMIKDALDSGIKKFIIGLGGSATNDAGTGMLEALGCNFYDIDNKKIQAKGENLVKIKKIDISNMDKRLKECEFIVACDVNNPLYGENGAAYVYAPQKGASKEMVKSLDLGLESFAKVCKNFMKKDCSQLCGAGAAGGLGFAFVSFLNAKLEPGFEIISKLAKLEEKIQKSNLVITGEGRIDFQSVMGKTPSEVGKIAKKFNIPVIAFAGCIGNDARTLNEFVDAYFCIQQGATSIQNALNKENAKKALKNTAYQAIRLFLARGEK